VAKKKAALTGETIPFEVSEKRGHMIHVASRIFNTPLLIEPNKLQAILHGIGDRMDITIEAPADEGVMLAPEAFHPGFNDDDFESGRFPRGRYQVREGVAILEISGTLVHKGGWLGSYSGMVSYDGLGRQLAMIADDKDVKALLLNIHTYGGEVAGCFDLADQLYQLRDSMPITALVSDAACSAGYAIASAANEIVVTQTGIVGSVGVVLTHYDMTGLAEKQGVLVTHIHAGKEKVLGSPFKSLSAADRKKLQGEVDDLYGLFLAKVARNRDADEDLFRSTEAATFTGEKAVAAGLANRVAAPREVLAEMIRLYGPGVTELGDSEDEELDDQDNPAAAAAYIEEESKMDKSKAAADSPMAVNETQLAEAKEQAAKAAITADRERITKITTCEEAKGRSAMANHLALETDMSAEAAIALLAKAPAEAAGSSLRTAMANTAQPGMAQADAPDGEAAPVRIDTAAIFASRRKAAA
jgi:signal peptide peptidase SppA